MKKSTHSPRVWKYERSAADPSTRSAVINRTNFAAPNGCWEWTGTLSPEGYGILGFNRHGVSRKLLAHRLALHLAGRPVPEDKVVDHLCRNRKCIRPEHLEIVAITENVMRGEGYFARNARKTHCPQGHVYSGDNVYLYISKLGNPARSCRACAEHRRKTKLPH